MSATEICPLCSANLQGDPVPEKYRQHFEPDHSEAIERRGRCFCLPYGDTTHFSRVIGIDGGLSGIYDGVIAWKCPDCSGWWHRFAEDDPRRARVENAMAS